MFAKIDVNGDSAAGLYQWLKSEQPGDGAWRDDLYHKILKID